MKKLTLVLSVLLVCALLLTSCAQQKDAYDLYIEMTEAMQDVKSADASADIDMKMIISGEEFDIGIKMDMQQVVRSETDIELKADMTIDLGSIGALIGMKEISMHMYFVDGFMYYDMLGQKIKMDIDIEEAVEMLNAADFSASSFKFEKDAISSSEVKTVGGDKEISFVLKGEVLNEMLDNFLAPLMQNMGMGDIAINFGDVSYNALIGKDSLPKEEHMIFAVEIEVMGESATAEYDMTIINKAFDSIDSIEFPNFDEYIEMDASAMGLL